MEASKDSLTSSDPIYRWDRVVEVSGLAPVTVDIPFASDGTAGNSGSWIFPVDPVGL